MKIAKIRKALVAAQELYLNAGALETADAFERLTKALKSVDQYEVGELVKRINKERLSR
jgi:hypothetical protein